MSNKLELLDAYLEHNKLRREGDCWDPIMPFMILDCVYQIYTDDIKPLKLKHEMKKWSSVWADNYNRVNNSFFRSFNEDQQDEVIEMMDDFQEWMRDDLNRVRMSLMKSVPVEDATLNYIVSSCLLCSALIKAAKFIFNNRFKKVRPAYGNPIDYLERMEKATIKIAAYFYLSNENYNPNASDSLGDDITSLCERIVSFLNQ